MIIFLEKQSDIYEMKSFQFLPSKNILVGVDFCIYQVQTEKKWDTKANSKVKAPAKNSTRTTP